MRHTKDMIINGQHMSTYQYLLDKKINYAPPVCIFAEAPAVIQPRVWEYNAHPRYKSYVRGAEKRGISFSLTVLEFNSIVSKACRYCGRLDRVGVDRIDSNHGYTADNTQPCCGRCNMMKHVMSEDNFLDHVFKIYNHNK